MHTMGTLHHEEESLFQVEKEDIHALLKLGYIDHLGSIDEDDLEQELIKFEAQLRSVREPREETGKEFRADELMQKIETIELIETIRQKIQELVIRKRNKFFGSYFYVTSLGAFYETHGENIHWKEILKRIPDLPYVEVSPSYKGIVREDDSGLTRNIPREYFSTPELPRSDK